MVETEGRLACLVQAQPVGAGAFQQAVGTDDIGLDEGRRAVDGTVHMGFGGQVHHRIGLESGQRLANGLAIGDIRLEKLVARIVGNGGQRLEVAGIGQLVEVQHLVPGFSQQVANEG
ncbi:hypothetical protein D9M71_41640 [compost metagenome]